MPGSPVHIDYDDPSGLVEIVVGGEPCVEMDIGVDSRKRAKDGPHLECLAKRAKSNFSMVVEVQHRPAL